MTVRGVIPFLLVMIVGLILIVLFPSLSLFLADRVY